HLDGRYTLRLDECAPGEGEFPLKYYAKKMSAIDPDMPVILEHLSNDEDYFRYMEYLKKTLF
ncbi:MAG: sugar phosphate isomerase/epimerase, partial [Lachnospiraceae bacterium]|nr:sugar phosphate isomerase/epimerase [Lachnospiraceae bacterium]